MDLSIKNTTREQRKEIVKKALAISCVGGKMPSQDALNLAKEYIDGNMEIAEIQKKVLNKYKK